MREERPEREGGSAGEREGKRVETGRERGERGESGLAEAMSYSFRFLDEKYLQRDLYMDFVFSSCMETSLQGTMP